jgi:hypothetical protein
MAPKYPTNYLKELNYYIIGFGMPTLQNGWSGELILHKKKLQSSNPVGVICNAKSNAVSSNTCSLFPESRYLENGNIARKKVFKKRKWPTRIL